MRRQAIRALKDLATEDDLDRLIHFIRDATWENGKMTVEVLVSLGESGHKALKKLALSEPVIPAAAYYLASQGDARGGDILAELLTSEDAQKQEAAMEFLAELHDPRCVPYLDEQLQTLTHWRTMAYARQLGEIGTPEAVDALIAALDREHPFTRRGAVHGLGIAKDPRAIPHLIRCLTDEDRKTRSEAAEALEQIGTQTQGAEACIAALQRELASDAIESRRRRNRVKNVLRKLGTL